MLLLINGSLIKLQLCRNVNYRGVLFHVILYLVRTMYEICKLIVTHKAESSKSVGLVRD